MSIRLLTSKNIKNIKLFIQLKDESAAVTEEALLDMGPTIKSNATSKLEATISTLSGELIELRRGRTSLGMLDHIIIDIGDVKPPLNQIVVVSIMDSKTLSINLFDPKFESATISSPLGLNPRVDGELTKELIELKRIICLPTKKLVKF
ncbi:hypothetical protein UlMin_037764 [Ulmus minor]